MAGKEEETLHFPDEVRGNGLEHVSTLVAESMRDAAMRRGFSTAKLLTGWAEIAGASVADVASPMKITYGRKGDGATLLLKVHGPRAQEVRMSLPQLIERINSSQGFKAIEAIRLTQARGRGDSQKADERPQILRRNPSSKELVRLRASVEGVEDEQLRDKLIEFGKSVLSQT